MRHPRSIVKLAGALTVVLAISGGLMLGVGPRSDAHAATSSSNSKVAEFDSSGADPADVVAGPDGSVWVALSDDKKVVLLNRSGTVVFSASLSGSPSSLATDGSGGVWVAEWSGNAIAHVREGTAPVEITLPTPNSRPSQVFDSGDFVFIAEDSTGHLGRLRKSDGTLDELPFTGATSPYVVTGIADQIWAADGKGQAWVLDKSGLNPVPVNLGVVTNLLLMESTDGTVRGLATVKDLANLSYSVFEFSRSATSLQTTRVIGGKQEVSGVAQLNGTTWFADGFKNTIGWVTASEEAEYAVPTPDSELSGMAVTEGRYIWSAERRTGKVVRVDTKAPDVERIGGAD